MAKKPEWSDYSYSNSDIAKRLGISREEVEDLKAEAAKKKAKDSVLPGSTNEVLAAVAAAKDKWYISGGTDLLFGGTGIGFSAGIPGIVELDYSSKGDGKIDILRLIKIETVRIKCYYIQRFYFADQYLYSDIQKVDSEDCNESEPEPEPEPEPPDPSLNDIDENKQPPSPNPKPRGNSAKEFIGYLTFKVFSFSQSILIKANENTSSISKYKGISYINRCNLHENAFFDIWEVNVMQSASSKIVSNIEAKNSVYNNTNNYKYYYCYDPIPLHQAGIISGVINSFFWGDKSISFHANSFSENIPPEGIIEYRFYANSTRNGGYFRGNERQVYWYSDTMQWVSDRIQISGGIRRISRTHQGYHSAHQDSGYGVHVETGEGGDDPTIIEYSAYSYAGSEVNQIINFYDALPPQTSKNPPIRINDRGENMSEDCCRIVKRMAKILAVDKFPYKTTPEKIKELTAGYEQQIIEKPKEELTFGDYLALTEFTDIYSQYRLRQIADAVGVKEFEREKNTPVGNILFAYFKYLKWLAENVGEFAMDYATWLRDVFPTLEVNVNVNNNGKTSSGNSEEKIDSIPKLLANQNKLVEEMHRVLGVDAFPASMPQSMMAVTASDGKVYEQGQTSLANYAELFGWYIDQFDKLMGQWTVDILIKDEDPLTPGDQSKKITLPNLAEAIAEIYGILLQQNINTTVALNYESRILPELGLTRQAAIKAFRAIETIIDYMGIEVLEQEELIQHTFDPTADELDKILGDKPEKTPVKIYEFDYKNGITLKSALKELAIAANIIKGVFGRRLDAGGDPKNLDYDKIKSQIVQNVKDMEKNARIVRKKDDKDWDAFKSQIENDSDHDFKIKDV